MDLTIRRFVPADYPSVVAIQNATQPEYPTTVEQARFWDDHRDPRCHFERWVVARAGKLVAVGRFGQATGWFDPRKFWIDLAVHPAHQGQGIGSALYDHLLDGLEARNALVIRTSTREDRTATVRFLANRGFEEDLRAWESRLDVTAFDPTPFVGAIERVTEQGIEIKTMRELAPDPERDRKLYDLDWLLDQDVPQAEPLTRASFDLWLSQTLENPNLLPDAYLVAVDHGTYVGASTLWRTPGLADLDTGLTGVRREYRRRGIALALKLRAIAYARGHGHAVIRTTNESNNRPMLSINERLGFVKQPAWIELHKLYPTGDQT